MSKKKIINIGEIIASLWVMYVFLGSLPYKFTHSEETQFIFGTIGEWMKGFLGNTIGSSFAAYGGYIIGFFELIISLILIMAIYYIVKKSYSKASLFFGIAGAGAMTLMLGAVFFHLFTPLGTEVNGDGGSLFRAAASIVFIGVALFIYNFSALRKRFL